MRALIMIVVARLVSEIVLLRTSLSKFPINLKLLLMVRIKTLMFLLKVVITRVIGIVIVFSIVLVAFIFALVLLKIGKRSKIILKIT